MVAHANNSTNNNNYVLALGIFTTEREKIIPIRIALIRIINVAITRMSTDTFPTNQLSLPEIRQVRKHRHRGTYVLV